ncbi:hypothetical protein MOQ_009045, partial [Trypanosoma cruzi marinkellei]
VQQGLITAERERLDADYANAIADVQNRNAQLNGQVKEAHNKLSVRESHIAGASDQVREPQQQLETTRVQLQEREARLNARDAQQAARDAETAGRDEVPVTWRGPADGPAARPNTAEDGVTTRPHQTHRLMAGGVHISAVQRSPAGQRRQAIFQTSQGNFGWPHFHHLLPLPSRTSLLNGDHSATEEDRSFCVIDVTNWPTRME